MKRNLVPFILGALVALLYSYLWMPFAEEKYPATFTIECATPAPLPSPTSTPKPKPLYSDESMMKSLEYGEVVWATYGHESGYGDHDSCRAKGKYNGFGYGYRDGGYPCYDTLKEVASEVSEWFVRELKTKTIRQALCYYNAGYSLDENGNKFVPNDCEYASVTMQMMGGAK